MAFKLALPTAPLHKAGFCCCFLFRLQPSVSWPTKGPETVTDSSQATSKRCHSISSFTLSRRFSISCSDFDRADVYGPGRSVNPSSCCNSSILACAVGRSLFPSCRAGSVAKQNHPTLADGSRKLPWRAAGASSPRRCLRSISNLIAKVQPRLQNRSRSARKVPRKC